MVRSQNGHEYVPTKGGTTAGLVIGLVAVSLWILVSGAISLFAVGMGAPIFFFALPLFGVAMLILIIVGAKNGTQRADAYALAKSQYDGQRQRIVEELNRQ